LGAVENNLFVTDDVGTAGLLTSWREMQVLREDAARVDIVEWIWNGLV